MAHIRRRIIIIRPVRRKPEGCGCLSLLILLGGLVAAITTGIALAAG
jgi:hypothetical protein